MVTDGMAIHPFCRFNFRLRLLSPWVTSFTDQVSLRPHTMPDLWGFLKILPVFTAVASTPKKTRVEHG